LEFVLQKIMLMPVKPKAENNLADLPAPHLAMLALEFRAPWEFASVLPAAPWLARAPRGDGHSVIVFPGLVASDTSTAPLRAYLRNLGYEAQGWEQGNNFGPRAGVLERAKAQLQRAADASGRTVSLLGWSLGGVYAREIAKELPDLVRGVITLGTPFSAGPKSTNAWRIFEAVSGRDIDRETDKYNLPTAPPVPTTSIYSRSDGIVAWQGSVQAPCRNNAQTENVEVRASHIGIGLNPAAWWVVADRLAQREGFWAPFKREGLGSLKAQLYPDPNRA
jgi:pimeloyl-ACP methyl ester carboxylesterase